MYTYRTVIPEDYPDIARIRNSYRPEPVTAEVLKLYAERERQLSEHHLHLVAVTPSGEAAGEVVAVQDVESPPGEWFVTFGVAPEHRRRGAGRELYHRAEAFARERGARSIRAIVEGSQEEAFWFALEMGFKLERQRLEAVLHLPDWDGARFGKQVASVRASGIRIVSLPALSGEDLLHQVYDLEMETLEEAPFFSGFRPAYEIWAREHTSLWPGEQFCTVATDGERLVGVSIIYLPPASGGGARQGFTAVRRAYRGRGIAVALKLVNIKECKARGVDHIRTTTDPENQAVQVMNLRLGFRPVPGPRLVVKHF
ncbi:MAG TPA: GNAT family N-acetyltransferase [Symbiobacteriaceae bacterium]|nr:GNAT family N-acetyltransferase [Symbiobacteriaceae bacterium]